MTASIKIVLTFSVSVEGLSECFNIIIPEKKESGQKKKNEMNILKWKEVQTKA